MYRACVRSTHSTVYRIESGNTKVLPVARDAQVMNPRHCVVPVLTMNWHCSYPRPLLHCHPVMSPPESYCPVRSSSLVCRCQLKVTLSCTLPTRCSTVVVRPSFRCRLINTANWFRFQLISCSRRPLSSPCPPSSTSECIDTNNYKTANDADTTQWLCICMHFQHGTL